VSSLSQQIKLRNSGCPEVDVVGSSEAFTFLPNYIVTSHETRILRQKTDCK